MLVFFRHALKRSGNDDLVERFSLRRRTTISASVSQMYHRHHYHE